MALILWILAVFLLAIWYISRSLNDYVQKLSKTKNILTVLPISVARSLPKMTQYCSSILQSRRCC
jgi:hypothetical protein